MAPKKSTPVFRPFFSKVPGSQTMLSPIFEKKSAGFPPAGSAAGGKTALFSKIGDSMVWLSGTLLKNGRKTGVLYFGPFWAKVAPNGEFLGTLLECKVHPKHSPDDL